jgi:hypothetical protein
MGTLNFSNEFKGDIGELIFEHYSKQNNFLYKKTEDIYKEYHLEDILTFNMGRERLKVKLPSEVVSEIHQFARPSGYIDNDPNKPAFVFDYMTIYRDYALLDNPEPKRFQWAEVKTDKSYLSPNQELRSKESKLGVHIFRIGLVDSSGNPLDLNNISAKREEIRKCD